jgi:cytochrome oxidase Cu insertion factor (SCO1/SenC/PrrC family)
MKGETLTMLRSLARPLLFACLFSSTAWGQAPAEKKAPEPPGIAVGEKAPSFKLKDQKGEERSLDDLLKKGKVALVFYRSAKW